MKKRFESFNSFYKFYLLEHKRKGTRIFHFLGTGIGLIGLIISLYNFDPRPFFISILLAYFLAWVSHFFIEHNRPATFRYPFYSFLGDLRMFMDLLLRKRGFSDDDSDKSN